MAQLMKGAPVAAAMTEQMAARTERLKQAGVTPTLCILRLGERPGDLVYERSAMKRCGKVGIDVREIVLPEGCTCERLLETIEQVNRDGAIHGLLMMRPLPVREDEDAARALLAPEKDVDGITAIAQSKVFTGAGAGYPPCTAQAVIEILDHYGVELAGRRAAVIGRSLVVGRPVAMMLMARDTTVTLCHTRTEDLPEICRQADILVSAAGRAGLVTGAFTRPGQVIVDVGINVRAGKLCGDVDFAAAEPLVGAITPVPGGVGAVTTAVLAAHVVQAAEKAAGLPEEEE